MSLRSNPITSFVTRLCSNFRVRILTAVSSLYTRAFFEASLCCALAVARVEMFWGDWDLLTQSQASRHACVQISASGFSPRWR